jgi:hypothetical protein
MPLHCSPLSWSVDPHSPAPYPILSLSASTAMSKTHTASPIAIGPALTLDAGISQITFGCMSNHQYSPRLYTPLSCTSQHCPLLKYSHFFAPLNPPSHNQPHPSSNLEQYLFNRAAAPFPSPTSELFQHPAQQREPPSAAQKRRASGQMSPNPSSFNSMGLQVRYFPRLYVLNTQTTCPVAGP